jgi:hypothetical protein
MGHMEPAYPWGDGLRQRLGHGHRPQVLVGYRGIGACGPRPLRKTGGRYRARAWDPAWNVTCTEEIDEAQVISLQVQVRKMTCKLRKVTRQLRSSEPGTPIAVPEAEPLACRVRTGASRV